MATLCYKIDFEIIGATILIKASHESKTLHSQCLLIVRCYGVNIQLSKTLI